MRSGVRSTARDRAQREHGRSTATAAPLSGLKKSWNLQWRVKQDCNFCFDFWKIQFWNFYSCGWEWMERCFLPIFWTIWSCSPLEQLQLLWLTLFFDTVPAFIFILVCEVVYIFSTNFNWNDVWRMLGPNVVSVSPVPDNLCIGREKLYRPQWTFDQYVATDVWHSSRRKFEGTVRTACGAILCQLSLQWTVVIVRYKSQILQMTYRWLFKI